MIKIMMEIENGKEEDPRYMYVHALLDCVIGDTDYKSIFHLF